MKTACFVIMVLLAVELATATPTTNHEPGLVKGIKRFLVRNGGIWTSGRKEKLNAGTAKTNSLVERKGDGLAAKKCITFEHCKKKKMSCAKHCSKAQGQVDKKHFPGKCFVKCKKCIPTC